MGEKKKLSRGFENADLEEGHVDVVQCTFSRAASPILRYCHLTTCVCSRPPSDATCGTALHDYGVLIISYIHKWGQ